MDHGGDVGCMMLFIRLIVDKELLWILVRDLIPRGAIPWRIALLVPNVLYLE